MIRGLVGASTARAGVLVVASAVLLGCPRRSDSGAGASASASALPAPVASGVPFDPNTLSALVNPDGKPAYAGPVGAVEGRVVATGDAPIDQPEITAQIPDSCASARPFYGKAFREGEGRALADVLVTVIGYHEYIPAREPVQRFVAKDCAFETRTIALTLGQRIEVVSGDQQAYVTDLLGEHGQAQIIATPGGKVAAMHSPTKAGRFVLIDNIKLFMTAEVWVLKYATIAVTRLDGKYRIEGLPPGDLTLSAFLPATGGTVQKPIKIEANKAATLDLEIPFDANAFRKALAAKSDGGVAPSASAAPKASGPVASASRSKPTAKPSPSAKR
jgi:hypothetical protein